MLLSYVRFQLYLFLRFLGRNSSKIFNWFASCFYKIPKNTTRKLSVDFEKALYEPKRKFRWVFEIDGIDAFVVKRTSLPSLSDVSGVGKLYFQTTFYDPVSPSSSKKLYAWLKSRETRFAKLKVLGVAGEVIDTWTYHDLRLIGVDFGQLDYSSSDPIEIVCDFNASDAVLT